jgi:diaminopimelate epimerase
MQFSKWHALGNAYLLVERADAGLTAELVRRLCDPSTGIGSDGVLELEPDGTEAAVTVWNPDGSQAEFSGNGARIAAAWLARHAGADAVTLRFGERKVEAGIQEDGEVELEVGRVEVGEPEELDLHIETVTFTPVDVGNPHAVVRRGVFDAFDVERIGSLLETHVRFPGRTNVQLVEVVDDHRIRVGVWERGAGATASSGSSAVAAAAASVANGWCESPVAVELPGGTLTVSVGDGRATLCGPVEEICRGETALG